MASVTSSRKLVKQLLHNSLVGTKTQIISAKNPAIIGVSGTIVKESKNMLTLEDNEQCIHIVKSQATFQFVLDNTLVNIDGYHLVGLQSFRGKRKLKTW